MVELETESGLGERNLRDLREKELSFCGSQWLLAATEVWLHETWPPPLDLLCHWLNLLFILTPSVSDEHINLWFVDILLV